jgi:hypothetical protein
VSQGNKDKLSCPKDRHREGRRFLIDVTLNHDLDELKGIKT